MVSLTTPTAAVIEATAPPPPLLPPPQTDGANALSLLSFMDIKMLLHKLTNY